MLRISSLAEREFLDVVVEKVKLNLKSLMVHIDHEHYDDIERALKNNRNKKDLMEQLVHDQRVVANWPSSKPAEVKKKTNYALLVLTLPTARVRMGKQFHSVFSDSLFAQQVCHG
jgi:hypothetical protein